MVINMKKTIIILSSVVICIIIVILGINCFINYKKWKIEKCLVDYINNGTQSEYLYENAMIDLEYAKNETINRYDITDFINNYIENIEKSVEAKIKGIYETNEIGYKYYEQLLPNKRKYDIIIRGLKPQTARHIIKNITDDDISNFNNKVLKNDIKLKLEKYFIHTKDDKWYIDSDSDEHIELPYNVYLDYVSNKRQNKKKVKKIIKINIEEPINKDYVKKNSIIDCKIKYEDFEGNIIKDTGGINIKYNDNDNIKINADLMLGRLFNTYPKNEPPYDYAEITAGQHDADIAEDLGNLSSARTSTWSYSTDPEFAYPDDSTEELREEEYYQSPILTLYEGDDMRWGWLWLLKYKTGEIKYATTLYKMYKIKTFDYNYKDKITYLPYEGIETIEELKERYLNDKERYEADKKWLYEPVELSEEEKKEAAEDKYKWEPINK